MTDTIEALLAGVEQYPRDNARKLIVADAIEEDGDQMTADAFRWAAKHNRHPKKIGELYRWFSLRPSTTNVKRHHLYNLLFKVQGSCETGRIQLDWYHRDIYSAFQHLGSALTLIRNEVM